MEKWSHVLKIFLIPETARDNCVRSENKVLQRNSTNKTFHSFYKSVSRHFRDQKLLVIMDYIGESRYIIFVPFSEKVNFTCSID